MGEWFDFDWWLEETRRTFDGDEEALRLIDSGLEALLDCIERSVCCCTFQSRE